MKISNICQLDESTLTLPIPIESSCFASPIVQLSFALFTYIITLYLVP